MPKYLQIQIPQACHENWDKMGAAEQGRYCNSCEKNVIDFTLMSDDDLAKFFKKNKGNVCGRFTNGQLNTDILIPARKIPWLKYFFQITIPAFLFSLKANGQTSEIKGKVVCVETKRETMLGEVMIEKTKTVKGIITDENGQPVSYASVWIKGTRRGTMADSVGNFTISLPTSNPVLVISAIGHSTQEINCTSKAESNITLPRVQLEVVSVGYAVVTKKKKRSLHIPALFNRNSIFDSISIFPNPISSNSKLNIKWKGAVASDQSIEIYSPSGNLVQHEAIRINKKSSLQTIDLKLLPAGTYFIKITDSKTHKSSSQQFIVQ